MRGHWPLKYFAGAGRGPPLNWLLFTFIFVVAVLVILNSPQPSLSNPPDSSPVRNLYRSYRRLREQAAGDLLDLKAISLATGQPRELQLCGRERENHVPCHNVTANSLAGFADGEELDRHCEVDRDYSGGCLVRPPKDYKIPLRWPAGKDVIWSSNVKITKDQLFSSGSLMKRLMLLEENQIAFHSEDGAKFDSVKEYSRQIAEMIGLGSDSEFLQAGVQNLLDIGCGFGSFGAHLFSLKLMTVCISTYEAFGSPVQLALERGLPAMIGSFISRQLPYPALSFDMVHCSQCGIFWDRKDGAFLIEMDRILKPGGYFVLTSPVSKAQGGSLAERNRALFAFVEEFAEKICWSLLGQQDETFIWQKTADISCYSSQKHGAIPLCKEEYDAGLYYQPLLSCISGTTSNRWIPIQNKSHSLAASQLSAEVLSVHGVNHDDFNKDSHASEVALRNYWTLLTPLIFSDHPKRPGDEDPLPPFNMIRNAMDMSARYGGLNAAFVGARKSTWVMNVVPTGLHNTLPLIIDRGFVGVLHNWCEPFPTYPRTYDLLHAMGLLSHLLESDKCSMSDLFLEMDRILRPEGWVVLRDKIHVVEKAREIATQIRWEARIIEVQSDNDQYLLVCQKPFLKK